jgi:hypothetical protein
LLQFERFTTKIVSKNPPQNQTYRGSAIQSSPMRGISPQKVASVATQPLQVTIFLAFR